MPLFPHATKVVAGKATMRYHEIIEIVDGFIVIEIVDGTKSVLAQTTTLMAAQMILLRLGILQWSVYLKANEGCDCSGCEKPYFTLNETEMRNATGYEVY